MRNKPWRSFPRVEGARLPLGHTETAGIPAHAERHYLAFLPVAALSCSALGRALAAER
jgi:hypothetical protein